MTDAVQRSEVTWETYVRAERFLPANATKLAFGLDVVPHWIDDTDSFWFRSRQRDGDWYYRVDSDNPAKAPAFDHVRLAAALSSATRLPFDAHQLPFDEIEFADGGKRLQFVVDGHTWSCNLATYECTKGEAVDSPPLDAVRSPNGKWEAFVRDHNLWVRSVDGGAESALTTAGIPGYGFGAALVSPLATAGLSEHEPPAVIWSPDSGLLISCRIDERSALQFHLVQSIPKDGSVRPVLHSYAYPLPGDDAVPLAEVWCFDVAKGTGVKAEIDPIQMLYYGSPIDEKYIWWSGDSSRAFLLEHDRGYLSYRLFEIDTSTGSARILITETSEHGIFPFLYWAAVNVRVISNGDEVLWYGHRDGWSHLFLHDGRTGDEIRRLTAGAFNVVSICHVDEQARLLYFRAAGREQGRDPYFAGVYRVSLDGGVPELLTTEDADHAAVFSPSGRSFIDTYSRVDSAPVSVLRSSSGEIVCELEQADITALQSTGWRAPERFVAKGRDGVTDVFGALFRPTNFDPSRVYPVIDSIYAGPQRNQAPVAFAGFSSHEAGRSWEGGPSFWHAQAFAELGFVVVMIDGLGMPGRSKKYLDVTYKNLGDAGLPDHITALRELVDRFPYLDLNRVGIYGHSAGGYASAHAMLTYPDFFKVCVSSAGNHDHRLDKATWVERYMGLPVGEHYREQANQTLAANLQGKLMLIHGELDENVHPASTLVLVDALIRENKDFDLLIMPNQPHACNNDPYFVRKRWDYFVEHLLNAKPPVGYRIAPQPES